MRITIAGTSYDLPKGPEEIPLSKAIEYQERYGNELDSDLANILNSKDIESDFKERLLEFHYMGVCVSHLAFFTGLDFDFVRINVFIQDSIAIGGALVAAMVSEESYTNSFDWNGEKWQIATPYNDPEKVTVAAFEDSQTLLDQYRELGKNRLEALQVVCATYLRKEGEAYNPEFIKESGERFKLMASLPMSIATHVDFFFARLMGTFLKHTQYLENQKSKEAEIT